MTNKDFMAFERLVRAMRNAQRTFFRVKSHENLLAAKKLEGEVDASLQREVVHSMFDRGEEGKR